MKEYADLLAWAAVVVSCATFIASIVIAIVAVIFGKRAIVAIGSHKVAELREAWKERLRSNIADLLRLREQLHTKSSDEEKEEMKHRMVRAQFLC